MIWSVQIENTAYCNRSCVWCPQLKLKFTKDQRMEWATLQSIVAELKGVNYTGRIHPYGNGEPLTDPEFLERIHYIRKHLPDNILFMATNGDFIGKNFSFNELLAAGINEIQVNHYDDSNEHLKNDMRPQIIHCDIGMLRTTFYNRAGNIPIANVTRAATCWWPGRKIYFNYKGEMLVCCSDWQAKYPIGNINKQPFMDMLNSPLLAEYKTKLAERRGYELPLCSQCNLIRHQEGGL